MLKVLSFRLGDELFGVEITKVKEINRNIEYTIIPRAEENIVGIFNMRGQIVTLFNIAGMLGYESKIGSKPATCIILKSQSGGANQRGFIIDRTGDVIDVNEEECGLPPANVDLNESKFIKAVVRLKSELMKIIKTDDIFN